MNQVLTQQLHEALESQSVRPGLRCESQLWVAASVLSRAHADEMSATTVVGTLGRDDAAAFEALVGEIEDELDLEGCVRLHIGSFSVRFTRRTDRETEARRI